MVTGVVAIAVVLILVCSYVNGFRVGGVTVDFGESKLFHRFQTLRICLVLAFSE
jgi:hypothetical protein